MEGIGVNCTLCGSENPSNARFCIACGSSLARAAVGMQAAAGLSEIQRIEVVSDNVTSKTEKLACRVLGGTAWTVVSAGTFIIAIAWLSLMDMNYYDDEQLMLKMIGYGVVAYGISAILFGFRAFIRTPR